jgi:hypothetical protein
MFYFVILFLLRVTASPTLKHGNVKCIMKIAMSITGGDTKTRALILTTALVEMRKIQTSRLTQI